MNVSNHRASAADRGFRESMERCEIPPEDFDHRAHVRLAYTYLTEGSVSESTARMRDSIVALLESLGVEPTDKFHQTLTQAWMMAVRHFMARDAGAASADEFIDNNPRLLDSRIMLTHYSEARLFSPQARSAFVPPDLDPIPTYLS